MFARPLNNDKIKLQPYVEGTGDHGIKRIGQEKLFYADLLSILVYLQRFERLPKFCVVAGAGGGLYGGLHFEKVIVNIRELCEACGWERPEWHLYDPLGFHHMLNLMETVKSYNECFTTKTAEYWKKQKDVLFLCDIRNTDKDDKKELSVNERLIHKDMNLQQKWVLLMQPRMAVLKFRSPYILKTKQEYLYHGCYFNYLAGNLFFEPYDRCNSTEMRLIVANPTHLKQYNACTIEQKCAYFNNHVRVGGKWDKQQADQIDDLFKWLLEQLKFE